MKQIRVVDNSGQEYFYPIDDVSEITIGRSQGNDIILGSKAVSRRHAVLKVMDGRIILSNQSANGVLVGSERVDRTRELREGEFVTIDVYRICVERSSKSNSPAPVSQVPSSSMTMEPQILSTQVPPAAEQRPVTKPRANTKPKAKVKSPEATDEANDARYGSKHLRSNSPADVKRFLGPVAPNPDRIEPRISLSGNEVEILPKKTRLRFVRFKSDLHDELKERLDLHSFEITDYRLPKVVRQVSEKLKEIISLWQHDIPQPYTRDEVFKEMMDEVCGLGPIEDLLKHRKVTEVMVVDRDHIYAELGGVIVLTDRFFNSEKSMMTVIERIVIPRGRRIDESTPLCDTRLADGSRVNAVIPPLALKDPCLTIRKFPEDRLSIGDLMKFKSLTPDMSKFLARAVRCRKNIIISGGTGSGKTTLLNVLSSFIAPDERIVTIEDAAELQLQQEHVVSLETKPANLEGKGAVEIRDLVKNALRMRPDRIIVGECRGGEAIDMLQAMNTGHDGSMTTVHSNSPLEAISRLETLVLMSGMDLPTRAIRQQIANSVDVIVQQSRFADGSRRISYITEVVSIDDDGRITLEDIYVYRQTGVSAENKVQGYYVATGYLPTFLNEFIIKGYARLEDFF